MWWSIVSRSGKKIFNNLSGTKKDKMMDKNTVLDIKDSTFLPVKKQLH